jgi:transglutaminase-like putative cysteine protease
LRRLLLLPLLLAALPTLAGEEVAVGPAPGWVERVEVADAPAPADVRNGIYALLTDHQVRVGGAQAGEYFRRVRKVLTSAGVQDASELSIDFDPSFETLVMHDVTVVRGGKRLPQLAQLDLRVIEKEPESEDRIYDGQRTAVLFLKDVRPGDILDYDYSLDGHNPLLGGKYADELELADSLPTRRIRHRLLFPANRPLQFRGRKPLIEQRGGEVVYVWQRDDVAPTADEDSTPSWFDPVELVQVTEFPTWTAVAQWANDLFQPDAASRAAVHALAARLMREHAGVDAQRTAAIRFVQDDIRYLGIEMGRNSHQPHQPADTLRDRYGDCKDKAFLLALLLRELGLDARPAMVNTRLRHRLDDYLPSPFVFDHVIVQVRDGGHTYWIDGTLAEQGGRLETLETPSDETALVVAPDTRTLATIRTRNDGSALIDETYDEKAGTLAVVATYRGSAADDLRARLATTSLHDLGRDHLNRFAGDHPRIEPIGGPAVHDDRDANVVVITERYRLRDFLVNGAFHHTPRWIADALKRPETMVRSMPLAFDYPLDVTERTTILFAAGGSRKGTVRSNESPTFHYERKMESDGNRVVITDHLRSLRDAVPVPDVPAHLAALNDVAGELPLVVTPRPAFAEVAATDRGVAIMAVLVGVLLWLGRRLIPKRA